MKLRASEGLSDSFDSDEEAPQLVPIRKKRLARLYYSKLERYRTIAELTAAHIQMKKEGKEERAYYWKQMKRFRTRRCSHASSWYSKNSLKLQEQVTSLMN
jgi:DNA/RNA endonuclease G (NUC1)